MKKKLLIIIIFFSCLAVAFSKDSPYVYIQPELDVTFSKNDEYILSVSGKRVVSYLEWEGLPLVYAGLNSGFCFNHFTFWFNSDFAIPSVCGKMYDSDWNAYNVKTTYSIHQNNAQSNCKIHTGLSYAFPIGAFTLTPKFSLLHIYDSFHAQNGYGWYGGEAYSKNGLDNNWDSEYARKAKKLYPIDLKRISTLSLFGVDFSFAPTTSLCFALGFSLALHAHSHSYDYHYGKPDTLNDFSITEIQTSAFDRFFTTFDFSWQFYKNTFFQFSAAWLYAPPVLGTLYDDDELVTQKSAAAFNSISIKTGVRWLLRAQE